MVFTLVGLLSLSLCRLCLQRRLHDSPQKILDVDNSTRVRRQNRRPGDSGQPTGMPGLAALHGLHAAE